MTHLRVLGFGVTVALAVAGLAACSKTPTRRVIVEVMDNRPADEAAIRAADAAWVKAIATKDASQAASFYADSAVLMAAGEPITNGKDAIQKAFAGMMTDPKFALTFAPAKVEVSKAGDLAYEIGDYEITFSDKKGKPLTTKAKYVVVWGKQADGSWKALVDAPNTTTN